MNNAVMNGDGFGVGWYHSNPSIIPEDVSHDGTRGIVTLKRHSNNGRAAAVYRDIYPAWNNTNLREICLSTSSNCIVAHVRAASKGTGISHQNCHPFKAGRLLFCHNGRIWRFSEFRRRFLSLLTDEAFIFIRGTTDSEAIFAMILTYLSQDGKGSPFTQKDAFGHERLVSAMKKTLRQIEILTEEAGVFDGYSTFNFSLTDGDTVVATRFCDKSPDVPPPSLYFAFGDSRGLYHELTSDQPPYPKTTSIGSDFSEEKKSDDTSVSNASTDSSDFDVKVVDLELKESKLGIQMIDVDPSTATLIICSNPLTTETHTWHKMPHNSIMWCTRGKHPELRLLNRRKHRYTISE